MYIGMDIGNKHSHIAVMDDNGNLISECRIENNISEFRKIATDYRNSIVALEATRNYMWIYDALERNGLKVKLVHPLKTKAIASARIKNDKLDAKILAHLLRSNLIAESYVPNPAARELREVIRYRRSLVHQRTSVKNRIQSVLAKNGLLHEFGDLFGKNGMQYLRDVVLPGLYRRLLDADLRLLNAVNRELQSIDSLVAEKCKSDNNAMLLTTMPGIGYYSALLIVSEIADINRFDGDVKLVSYSGLNPSIRQSGNTIHRGHITKQGSKLIRSVIVNCANVAIRNDGHLKEFYQRIKVRKGHKVAIVAVARKMLVYMYHMLKKQEEYKLK